MDVESNESKIKKKKFFYVFPVYLKYFSYSTYRVLKSSLAPTGRATCNWATP